MSKLAPGNVTLIRGLGLTAAVSINIANMIGTGVFLKARVMTCNVGSPGLVIAVWIVAGLLSLAGALTYAELTAMMPRAGGEYVLMREGYGPGWGFIYGWTQFLIARTGSAAALAVGFAIFLNDLTGGALNQVYFTLHLPHGYSVPFGQVQLVALAAIAFTTLINCAAVNISGGVASVLTFLKIALVLGVGVGAFLYAQGHWSNFSLSNIGGTCEGVAVVGGGLGGFGAAMLGALWAYDGWNNICFMAGEVRHPGRNLPLAFIGGMLVVGALYVFVNLGYFYVLTPTEVASVPAVSSVAAEVTKKFLGPLAVSFVAAALMISSFGALHTSILSTARIPYAMSRDRLFFQGLARLSRRTHVPTRSLIVQGIWAGVLALSGSYDTLTDYAIFALWLFYGLVTASVFIFRKRMPNAERPYRTWGYPVVPILFLLVTAGLIIITVRNSPVQSLIGLGLIALGFPVYLYWSNHNRVRYTGASTVDEDSSAGE
ncbi:MAG: basic amino acid/polyamine antiporter, family [Blastocatellia bacterium]|jgi:APA family basic amino acid/polyamine antiporter|nr:basic amino acid/polyamine antiporter, family [Blastocatellia bacterium]